LVAVCAVEYCKAKPDLPLAELQRDTYGGVIVAAGAYKVCSLAEVRWKEVCGFDLLLLEVDGEQVSVWGLWHAGTLRYTVTRLTPGCWSGMEFQPTCH
jgi:hypothetical protein